MGRLYIRATSGVRFVTPVCACGRKSLRPTGLYRKPR